ncbi:MAG: DNA-processing protein DprA [Micropruina sp.]|nr:MAG: DNA-processing protein DprA [Micropruina sp.]
MACLADLGVCETVQEMGGAPYGLWARGVASLAALADRSVSIVGSRASTPYGDIAAAELAADLAGRGVTVISGGAFGIDVAAHRGRWRPAARRCR